MVRIFRHYVSGPVLVLLVGDWAVVLLSFRAAHELDIWLGWDPLWPKVLVVCAITTFVLNLGDLYNPSLHAGRRELIARILVCQAAAGLVIAAVGFAVPDLRLGRAAFFQIGGGTTLGLLGWRVAALTLWSSRIARLRVLVLGTGPIARHIAALEARGARPFTIVGFLDDAPGAAEEVPEGYSLLGKFKDLPSILEESRANLIVISQFDRRGQFPAKALLDCRLQGVQVEDWPAFYEKETGKILVTELRPSWLIFSEGFVKTGRTEMVKRAFDVSLALIGLLAALPVMLLAAVAIKLDSRGPVLFRQPRLGRHGRLFILKKFRSMGADAERQTGAVWAQADDPRITRIGRLLRRTRIDELPQLLNVLAGDMSFIGPRPERPEFFRQLRDRIPLYLARLSVKPGITGWAQVRYRYGASVEDATEKLQYDLYYIKNLSLFLDLLILINTVQVVLFARGR
jgi:sugar transferase (PEP-CTERM system associated)